MTKDEILALSGEVVAALWQDWWPVREAFCTDCCWGDRCDEPRHFYRPNCPKCLGKGKYPVPPPDLTEPANFLRALNSIGFVTMTFERGHQFLSYFHRATQVVYACSIDGNTWGEADTPELALLLALVDYVRRGKA